MYWQQVWLGILHADRMTRCCLLLQAKHARTQQHLDWLLAVPVVAAVVTLAIPLATKLQLPVLGGLFTIISAVIALNRRRDSAVKAARGGASLRPNMPSW